MYGPAMSEPTTAKRPGVAQTMTLLFDNDPTWADLYWFVEQAKAAGVEPTAPLIFEWDDHEQTRDGISFFQHPETS